MSLSAYRTLFHRHCNHGQSRAWSHPTVLVNMACCMHVIVDCVNKTVSFSDSSWEKYLACMHKRNTAQKQQLL